MEAEHDLAADPEPARPEAPSVVPEPPPLVLARAGDPVAIRALSRTAGNRATGRVLARHGGHKKADDRPGTYLDPMTAPEYDELRPLLRKSPWGRDAMEVMRTHQVKTLFASDGMVANFAPSINRMRLNTSYGTEPGKVRWDVVSAYYVHEMYHASQHHAGKSYADATGIKKKTFVNTLVTEESEGTALGFLHKIQLERTAGARADDNPAGVAHARRVFDDWYQRSRKEGKSVDDSRTAGRDYLRKIVTWQIDRDPSDSHVLGEIGPSSIMSYREFYEQEWAGKNPQK